MIIPNAIENAAPNAKKQPEKLVPFIGVDLRKSIGAPTTKPNSPYQPRITVIIVPWERGGL